MLATDLAPRDSSAPVVRALDPGGPFSPNGDGQVDSTTIKSRFTETVAWTLRVHNATDDLVFETAGSGAIAEAVWNGLVDGHPVPDGAYKVTISGVDGWDNAPANATRTVRVDTVAPALEGLAPGGKHRVEVDHVERLEPGQVQLARIVGHAGDSRGDGGHGRGGAGDGVVEQGGDDRLPLAADELATPGRQQPGVLAQAGGGVEDARAAAQVFSVQGDGPRQGLAA
jgi:hypothetical protein